MRPSSKRKRTFIMQGFTLLEAIMVITIVGIAAGLALPKYHIATERARSAEGVNILASLLAAERRFALENNNTYTNNLANLDIAAPFGGLWGNFNAPTLTAVVFGSNSNIASIVRNDPGRYNYTLSITEGTGTISCANGVVTICGKMGY